MFMYPFPKYSAGFTNIVHIAVRAGDQINDIGQFTYYVFW